MHSMIVDTMLVVLLRYGTRARVCGTMSVNLARREMSVISAPIDYLLSVIFTPSR